MDADGGQPLGSDAGSSGGEDGGKFDASVFDGPLPDASNSPVASFEVIYNGAVVAPLSCPTSNWEFALPSTGSVTLRNTGGVSLAYIAEPTGYIGGVTYTPGVPTSQSNEEVGVLAPGATVNVTHMSVGGDTIALVGAEKPFSIYDSGFAPADEWTTPWPNGVGAGGGATTMYVADVEWDSDCSPVIKQ